MAMITFSRTKRLLIALNVVVMIAIAAALFLGVSYLASLPGFRTRIDLTKEKEFTLSPMTLDLLGALEKEIEVISISQPPIPNTMEYYTGISRVEWQVMQHANQILEEYVIHSSGRLKVQTLSWDRDNLKVREIADRIDLGSRNTMVFLCGTNRKDLVPFDLAQIDRGGLDPMTNVFQPAEVRSFKVESAVTTALLSVMEEDRPKVYVTTGRREASLQDMGVGGLARAVAGLKMRLNFEVEELKLYQDKIVPPDCDVLIIPGPLDDFSAEEVAAVQRFLYGGGRLFLALSPFCSTSLEELLADFDIGLNRDITCREPAGLIVSDDEKFRKSQIETDGFNAEMPITRALAEAGIIGKFFQAGAVNHRQGDENVHVLVHSPGDCWGDAHAKGKEGNYFFDSASEERGPRVLGVACEGQGPVEGARLVFFADTYFYSIHYMQSARANEPLFMNAVNWLAAREYLLDIPPKTSYESRVDLTEGEYNDIGLYVVIIIPAAAALLGFLVWWLRRR